MVIIKRDGRKILFYRTGEDDWFLGVRVSSVDEFVKTHNRLHSYIWFSGDLEDQFLAICEDIKMRFKSLIEKAVAKNWRADKTKTAQCTARSNRTGQSYRLACVH